MMKILGTHPLFFSLKIFSIFFIKNIQNYRGKILKIGTVGGTQIPHFHQMWEEVPMDHDDGTY